MDENWINSNKGFGKGWVPSSCPSFKTYKAFTCSKNKVGKGPRLVVIGIVGNLRGLILNLTRIYKITTGKSEIDYHKYVDGPIFTKWIMKVM